MFEHILAEQNPHWSGSSYSNGIQRQCFSKILDYLELPHVISIMGVRRAGKSTLLKQTMNYLIHEKNIAPINLLFINLEHPYFSQYANDVLYLEKIFEDYLKISNPKGHIYCFLDEIQFFSKWPIFIKAHYEQKNVKFIITGSNSFLMSHDLLTLLSGRTLSIDVYPLSFNEFITAKTTIPNTTLAFAQHRHEIRRLFDEFIRIGGFPEVALLSKESPLNDILSSYAKTILYQDVASRLSLKKPLDLERLFYYLSSHIGSLFTYIGLAKLFNLTDKTIKNYIKALMDANLLFELDKFSFFLKQQIRSPKKIYAIDTGMINAIAFKISGNHGKLFENIIFLELKRRSKEIYYYKTTDDYEIDFVVREQGKITLIQVCGDLHSQAETREIRSLVHAAKEFDLKEGIVITPDLHKEWVIDKVTIRSIPIYQFISDQKLTYTHNCCYIF